MNKQRPKLDWIFDPVPPSGQIVGGVPMVHVFRPDLDVFVREVLQNSHDQALGSSDQPVQVTFSFIQLDGKHKHEFLNAIGWDHLEEHLKGATQGHSVMATRLAQSLNGLEGAPLVLLRIDDSGTVGLTGGEDERKSNFTALCRNVLDTIDDQPKKGGSYGLGKAVLWRFSAFSTVLFSSRVKSELHGGLRFFARAELPYHQALGDSWNGPGWYGEVEERPAGHRAVSVWDAAAERVARPAHLFRGADLGTGTSILIVGFSEPGHPQPRPLSEIAHDILESSTRWFWPSISLSPASLRVSANVFLNGDLVFHDEASPGPDVLPFIHAVSANELVSTATNPGEVSEAPIPILIPGRRNPEEPQISAEMILRVIRGEPGDPSRHANTVALVRGAGMVVDYRAPSRRPLGELPFFGVLRAGEFAGSDSAHIALERFLRAAEPPAHNAWESTTERIQAEYKQGARTQLDTLWTRLGAEILRRCEQGPPPQGQGPSALSRLFPLGASRNGGAMAPQFRVEQLKAWLVGENWSFSGFISRDSTASSDWTFDVLLSLDGETGRGNALPISNFVVEHQDVRTVVDGLLCRCYVPKSVRELAFRGRSDPVDTIAAGLDARRTRARIEIRPRREDER